jgi:glycyl-tRNA synthetase (class II)
MMSEQTRVSGLARKLAIMEQSIVAVYKKADGTFSFAPVGVEMQGEIVEYRHYL